MGQKQDAVLKPGVRSTLLKCPLQQVVLKEGEQGGWEGSRRDVGAAQPSERRGGRDLRTRVERQPSGIFTKGLRMPGAGPWKDWRLGPRGLCTRAPLALGRASPGRPRGAHLELFKTPAGTFPGRQTSFRQISHWGPNVSEFQETRFSGGWGLSRPQGGCQPGPSASQSSLQVS